MAFALQCVARKKGRLMVLENTLLRVVSKRWQRADSVSRWTLEMQVQRRESSPLVTILYLTDRPTRLNDLSAASTSSPEPRTTGATTRSPLLNSNVTALPWNNKCDNSLLKISLTLRPLIPPTSRYDDGHFLGHRSRICLPSPFRLASDAYLRCSHYGGDDPKWHNSAKREDCLVALEP